MREFLVDVLTSILIKKNKPVSYFFLLTNLLYEEKENGNLKKVQGKSTE